MTDVPLAVPTASTDPVAVLLPWPRTRRETDPTVLALIEVAVDLPTIDKQFILRSLGSSADEAELSPKARRAVAALRRCAADLRIECPSAKQYVPWRAARLAEGGEVIELPSEKAIRGAFDGSWPQARAAVLGRVLAAPDPLAGRGRRLGKRFSAEQKRAALRRFAREQPKLIWSGAHYDRWAAEGYDEGRITPGDRIPRAAGTFLQGPGRQDTWFAALVAAGVDVTTADWSVVRAWGQPSDLDEVAELLREAHVALELGERPLTKARFTKWRDDEIARVGKARWIPSQETVCDRFGGFWGDACAYAGLPPDEPVKRDTSPISTEEMRLAMRRCAEWADGRPSGREYGRWRESVGDAWEGERRLPPTVTHLYRVYLSWPAALDALLGPERAA